MRTYNVCPFKRSHVMGTPTYAGAVARGQSSSVSGKIKGGDRYTKRDVIQNVCKTRDLCVLG